MTQKNSSGPFRRGPGLFAVNCCFCTAGINEGYFSFFISSKIGFNAAWVFAFTFGERTYRNGIKGIEMRP